MAFYGNVTNTSKTTFAFDRTYSNRYEMDLNANRDGVFVGRYVLVDYDVNLKSSSYILDKGNEHLYLYDNAETADAFNLYTNEPTYVLDKYNNKLYTVADHYSFYEFSKELDDGRCLVLHPKHVIKDCNRESLYIKAIEWKPSETAGVYYLGFEYKDKNDYIKFWSSNPNAQYTSVVLDSASYEPYTYYYRDKDSNKYVLAESTLFDPDLEYYDLGDGNHDKVGIVDGKGIFYGNGEPDFENGTIYRVNKGMKYNRNAELEYWAIVGWTTAKRWIVNPNYNIADPQNNQQMIEADIEVPTWGQLAAVNGTVENTYETVENPDPAKIEEYYVFDKGVYRRATAEDTGPFYTIKYEIDLIPVKGGQNYNYDDDYTINMTIDRTYYGTSRGYDSTVWQKMYRDGRDVYVMVAELNSVVPTFDVEADAPTSVPLAPHFDPDSSNVFYRLHVQTPWGMRTKFADPNFQLQRINVNGQILEDSLDYARVPNASNKRIMYPSDQTVSVESDFYDKYNDEKSHKYLRVDGARGLWVDEPPTKDKSEVPAAIYYNKAGFNPNLVAYSIDVIQKGRPLYNQRIEESGWKNEDRFEVTPTGRSGLMYDNHGYGAQTTLSVDTQEFSVMLPSLGDTIAKMWDLIYGGRDTNEAIRQTHKRNKDVAWEDARKGQDRRGLRMVGAQSFNGYNKSETDTLAGCINSVHDLMGMIISPKTPHDLAANLEELNEDYIYYVDVQPKDPQEGLEAELCKYKGQFMAKYKTYEYTPYEGEVGNFSEVVPTPGVDLNNYWVLVEGVYRPAKEGDIGPFYLKGDVAKYEPVAPEDGLEAFDGTKYYYNDGCSLAGGVIDESMLLESDYVREKEYQRDRQYYELSLNDNFKKVDVSQEFEPGRFFYYQDGDYVLSMEKTANPTIKYYEINEDKLVNLTDEGFDNVYSPGVYFYRDKDKNYIIDTDDDGHWDHDEDGTETPVGHYLAIAKKNPAETIQVQKISYIVAELTEKEIATFDPSAYYIERENNVYVQNTAPYEEGQVYYYKVVSLINQPSQEIYEVGDYVNLVPYTSHTFYCKVFDDENESLVVRYEHLTAQRIREIVHNEEDVQIVAFGVNELDQSEALLSKFDPNFISSEQKHNPNKWACQEQSVFYVPGLYHYQSGNEEGYTDLILDMYATMWHKGSYYKMVKEPTPVNKNFYEPYKYYTQNANGEYVLIKDSLTNEEINDLVANGNIFLKETYYVYEDTSGTFPKGMEWNPNVVNVPDTVTLATRKEKVELRVLEGFARDLNTIHGLILYINRLLMSNDEFTRDDRTLQGAINTLNDKIAQFGAMTPNEVMVVDSTGRTQSAEILTYQKDTASKVKGNDDSPNTSVNADTYAEVEKLEDMREQWITVNVDADVKNPKFTVHHNFQAVTNTTSEANLNKDKVESQDIAHDTLDFYTPIVDAMGHVVGNNTHKVTLPYGFKFIKTNGNVDSIAQLTTAEGVSVAESTQDEFTFNTGNKWIRTAMDAENDTLTIAHETHSLTVESKDDTDLNNVASFTVQDTQYDEAGHITHNQPHTYKLPFNFKTLSVGAAVTDTTAGQSANGDIVANDHVAKFTISPNNRWITMSADTVNDILSIGHAYAGAVSQNDLQGENQTPKFGASFNIPYNGFDQAGHLSSFGTKTVTLPKPSLNVATGDVVSEFILKDDTTGQFEMTKKNVGTFAIVDYVADTEDVSDITNEDTINKAFAKLQAQAKAEIKNREDALSQEVEDRNAAIEEAVEKLVSIDNISELTPENGEAPTNLVVGGVTQENGVVSVTYRALEETDLPSTALTLTTEFTYNYEEPVEEVVPDDVLPDDDTTGDDTTGGNAAPVAEDETEEEEIIEVPAKTIQWLFDKVAALEARIYELEHPTTEEEEVEPPVEPEEPGTDEGTEPTV